MSVINRPKIDRRRAKDRRQIYNLDYFLNGGTERRSGYNRRSSVRWGDGWNRIEKRRSIATKARDES
ncbi:MAG: hypothetical protein OES18_24005 [Deltaproteobacteria bacterium]|nr:hypothetical protein [Deltaproteobacteria bacterium]